MKRCMLLTLMLLPILGVLGESNQERVVESELSVSTDYVNEMETLSMLEGPYKTKFNGRSYASSSKVRKPKTYIQWNRLTWDSDNRMFLSLMVGAGIFQHERIFREVKNSHIMGLKFNPAVGVTFGYRFNHIWTFRAKYMYTNAFYAQSVSGSPAGTVSVNTVSLNAGFDLVRLINPYNDGKHNLSPYLGIGVSVPSTYIKGPVTTSFGLAYTYDVSERISLNLDAEMLMLYGVDNKNKNYPAPFNFLGSIMAGVSYRF